MSKVLVTESYMTDLGDAIREKNGTSNHYKPNQMGAAVRALPDPSVLVPKTITQNGNYDPDDDNADGYSSVAVNVPNSYGESDEGKVVSNGALVAQTSVTVTENGTVDTMTNDEVVVAVSAPAPMLDSLTVTENGTYTPGAGVDGFDEVTVNVSGGGGGGTTYQNRAIGKRGSNAVSSYQSGNNTYQNTASEVS